MPEGQPQPIPQEVISQPETGSSEGFGNIVTSLIEQQTILITEDEAAIQLPSSTSI